jgi:hypothetical protein
MNSNSFCSVLAIDFKINWRAFTTPPHSLLIEFIMVCSQKSQQKVLPNLRQQLVSNSAKMLVTSFSLLQT